MDDPADDASIVLPLRPGVDHRKMRRERRKLFIRQPKIVRHESSPPYGLESRQITQINWVHTLMKTRQFASRDLAMARNAKAGFRVVLTWQDIEEITKGMAAENHEGALRVQRALNVAAAIGDLLKNSN